MTHKKNIFIIIGSASKHSSGEKLIDNFISLTKDVFDVIVFNDLRSLPHFDPELSIDEPPQTIKAFRASVDKADGIIIATPEYIFSIPSGLKNAIEWCVSTTLFTDKPTGLITASAQGKKGHEELQLVMKTVMAKFTNETTLLIQGVKGKINNDGKIIDEQTLSAFLTFIEAYKKLLT
ncbi:NAD(P)H-dependent oxidoreductase [Ferruginibacter albus]|nr:NAD(P)H-dependent oxidoreductase [Ferruginibacter albus]